MLNDKAKAKEIQNDIIAALSEVAKKHGVKIAPNGGTLVNSGELSLKFRITLAAGEQANESAKLEWNKNCWMFNLKPDDYMKVISINGEKVQLVGFQPRRRKFPILARKLSSNKEFLYPVASIEFALKMAAAA
jgi:hypothetical protein